jgi:hypothetical protein
MPTDVEHTAVYRDNRTVLDGSGGLLSTNSRWAAVVAFYAAVHLIERLAAQDGCHHTRHSGANSRQIYLAAHPVHHVLLHHLTALRTASELARYHSLSTFESAFPAADVDEQLVGVHLRAIEQYVLNASP